jgi:type IV pilus assembly protein PilC
MALFTYKVTGKDGKIITDTLTASSKSEAVNNLKSAGYQILALNLLDTQRTAFEKGVSVNEKAAFCRFASTMLKSGLAIPEIVKIIEDETKNPHFKKILADIGFQTQKGQSLSAVLSKYKNDFDPIFLTMVSAGEQSGTLEKSFSYLARQLSASHELTQKITGSLMYPAVIIFAMLANGLVMMVFVLPRIASAFLRLEVPLPIYTKLLLGFGEFIGKNTLLVVGGGFGIMAAFIGLFFIRPVRKKIIHVMLSLPVIRGVVKQIDIARFSRTLSTLLANGVSIVEALDVSANTLTSKSLREEAATFGQAVSRGESLASILTSHRQHFPPILIQTIRAGESSGSLDVALSDMATFYESEVEFTLKKLTGLLEPVLMLLIGAVVGVMVVVMIAPIYSVIGGLQETIKT